jgi:hypothetical protein
MATLNPPLIIAVPVTADATGGINVVVPRAGTVIDVWVVASATSGGGTVTVSKAGAAITAALAMAADNALTRAAALTRANADFAANEVLRVVAGQAADRGIVYVSLLPTPGATLA